MPPTFVIVCLFAMEKPIADRILFLRASPFPLFDPFWFAAAEPIVSLTMLLHYYSTVPPSSACFHYSVHNAHLNVKHWGQIGDFLIL